MDKRKIISAAMAAVMVLGCGSVMGDMDKGISITASADLSAPVKCGPQAYWSMDEFGTLFISGNGPVYDWSWDETQVKSVSIDYGITSLSYRHFKLSPLLKEVRLPNSMTDINGECFMQCRELTSVKLSDNIKTIGDYAFLGCDKLKSVTIKSADVEIGTHAFGFTSDKDINGTHTKIEGFTIYGYSDSTAQKYAEENELGFVALDLGEELRGDTNNDKKVDIEDAVMVIGHVNGQSALYADEKFRADIDGAGKIDIEDAVNIISHVNGQKVITPPTVKVYISPQNGEPDEKVTVTFKEAGEVLELVKTQAIPAKYGRGTDPADLSTYDEASWYTKGQGTITKDGKIYNVKIGEIYCPETGLTLQQYIETGKPVTEDTEFMVSYWDNTPALLPGWRTMKAFEDIADGNYKLKMSGKAAVSGFDMDVSADMAQSDANNGYCFANADSSVFGDVGVTMYTIDASKYYVRDAENKQYSDTPGMIESFVDLQAMFREFSENRDKMTFVEERDDEETGWIVEVFRADIPEPFDQKDCLVEVSYDKETGEMKKLFILESGLTKDEMDDALFYIIADNVEFSPELAEAIDHPNFEEWTKV